MADEGITFNEDGTITVTFDDTLWRLGRPKVGQFRTLRERLHDLQAAVRGAAAEAAAEGEDADAEAQRAIGRNLVEKSEGLAIGWVREAFSVLADKPLDLADEDLPLWLVTDDTILDFVRHWRERPFASGARRQPAQPPTKPPA